MTNISPLERVTDKALDALKRLDVVLEYFHTSEPIVKEHDHYPVRDSLPDYRVLLWDGQQVDIEVKDRKEGAWDSRTWVIEQIDSKEWCSTAIKVVITSFFFERFNRPETREWFFQKDYFVVLTGRKTESPEDREIERILIRRLGDLFKFLIFCKAHNIDPLIVLRATKEDVVKR